MSEYDMALDNQVEWASFWTSDYGTKVYHGIGRAISKKRAETGENYAEGIVDSRSEQAILEMMPLINGECFYWSRGIINLVGVAANSLPDNWFLTKQHIPAPCGFFWLAKEPQGIEFRGLRAFGWALLDVEGDVGAIQFPQDGSMPQFNEVAIITFIDNSDFPKPIPSLDHIGVGQSLNDWRLEHSDLAVSINADPSYLKEEYDSLRLFATMLSFIQQRVLVMSRQVASRATRKRMAFSNRRAEAEINIIKLRRVVHQAHKGEGIPIEWGCQWFVRGHWRDQWYPSIRRNQPLWISPYIKGPEDKPLRDPGRLFAVVR